MFVFVDECTCTCATSSAKKKKKQQNVENAGKNSVMTGLRLDAIVNLWVFTVSPLFFLCPHLRVGMNKHCYHTSAVVGVCVYLCFVLLCLWDYFYHPQCS